MKHTKITVGFATLLCIFSLAGCQSKPQNQPVETETEMQQTNTASWIKELNYGEVSILPH